MRPITVVRSLPAAVVDSVALAQTLPSPGTLVLNGTLVSGGVATLSKAANLSLTSTGNLSGISFTIVGTDYRGYSVTEVLVGPNNNTVPSVNTYVSIASITASAAVGTAVSAGNAATGSSPVVPVDLYLDPFELSLFLEFNGTANATVQYTGDDVNVTTSLDALAWISHTDMTGKTSTTVGTLVSPVTAVRFLNNSGTGTVTLRVLQAGAAP